MNKTPRIITRHFGQGSTQVALDTHRRLLWTTRRSLERAREKETRTTIVEDDVDAANDCRLRGVSIAARRCRIDDETETETESDDDDDVDGNDGTARE
jgi:hypothetical protein